jgi:predicted nuclease of predicted toxin-antitoxin system
MMQLMIIDECMSPRIVPLLCQEGHDVIHVRDRNMLQAPDHVVWRFAINENRTVCTVNGTDFKKLAAKTADHPGVLVIPNGHNPNSQFTLLKGAIDWVSNANAVTGFNNRYIEVGSTGEILLAEMIFLATAPASAILRKFL